MPPLYRNIYGYDLLTADLTCLFNFHSNLFKLLI